LRRPIAVAAILAALVVAALGAVYSAGAKLGPHDGRTMPLEGLRPPWRDVAQAVDLTGEPVGAAMLLATVSAVCLALRRPRMAVLTVAGVGATAAVTTLLKPLVGRQIHGDYLAYPSGHTALATAVAIVAALLAVDLLRPGRRAAVLLVLAAAGSAGAVMAWSQTILSNHYATDTIGGFCTALASMPATAILIDRIADLRSARAR